MKRIVLVTGDDREHKFVTNALTARFDVAAILVCDPPAKRSWSTVLRRHPTKFIGKALRTLFLKAINDRAKRSSSLARVLGDGSAAFRREDLVRRVGKPKAGGLLQAVAELNPDILAIYGTGMIPNSVLHSANEIALNMHTGLSPHYRGVQCAMWPILDERPGMVGATVHQCTAAVDGGEIFFTGKAQLNGDEDLHGVFARAVKVGAMGYIEVIASILDGTAQGRPQDLSQGIEYRGNDLSIWTEIGARRALKSLKARGALASGG